MNQSTRTLLAGGLLALALFGAARAGPLEDAKAATERRDYATAMSLWRPLAEQGNAVAQLELARMYYAGYGVPPDLAHAVALYRKAADQGYADAQWTLGWMYERGDGMPQDYAQAVAWYRKAADQGYAWGQFNLGMMYMTGTGGPQDYVRAHMLFNLAASGMSDASARGLFVKSRADVAAKMTPAQIAEAQRMASEWVQSHPSTR